ncbi:P-loop containing nucleoside triphosphate hydrolase protein [Marasmius fiardii PR-910]|nr:P-loop containing nucleoside triphosphate hydrolase protein [Marasmius fiardii PR-910]
MGRHTPAKTDLDSHPLKLDPEAVNDNGNLVTLHLGVYRVVLEKKSLRDYGLDFLNYSISDWLPLTALTKRLLLEIISVDVNLILLYVTLCVCEEVQDVFLLSIGTHLLQIIESGLINHSLDCDAVVKAFMMRTAIVVLFSVIARWRRQTLFKLKHGVKYYYEETLLNIKLNMDLPTLNDNNDRDHITSDIPWKAFDDFMHLFTQLLAFIARMGLVANLVRSGKHGLALILLCMVPGALNFFASKNMWMIPRITQVVNPDYLRMHSLMKLSDKRYKHDILSGNIPQYIINEFKKARTALGSTDLQRPELIYQQNEQSWFVNLKPFAEIYYALIALFFSRRTSIALIATLYQASTGFRMSFNTLFWAFKNFEKSLSCLREMYDLENARNFVKDGDLPYPFEKESALGMSIEFRNVSFCYPGQPLKAVDDVSVRIESGQLVVIVGQNGSGKSTLVNLVTRMLDASSGQVLVDELDVQRLRISDLRDATTVLTQQHQLFPSLSILENVGIGYPDAMMDEGKVMNAIRKGGAEGIVGRLAAGRSGLHTILEPFTEQALLQANEEEDCALAKGWKSMKKTIDVSGGERQRLVAARAFMRMDNSSKVKLVVVDEPTSALDRVGEYEMFGKLMEAKAGKTMLFITHHMGLITERADVILCMKDGKIVEQGTHRALMVERGVYFDMYKAAQALMGNS